MVKIIIDGQELEASPGEMIIEVADDAGIYIPRFCYHKKLSIAANCRMCLVEVANHKKNLPACATPVVDGMQIFTKSKQAIYSQRSVMEFLLINHPLDCPICDQGGECELQDLSMGYGGGSSNFTETKRVVPDHDIGPFITTNMTRCIHCTRCIRFGKEIVGVQELGLINRGDETEVRTYVNETVKSNLSGNLIDICPVGALNSKPYAYQARSWELKNTSSVAPHDCLGANIFIHSREQQIFRVVARENQDINEVWISDRDRFSYLGIQHDERLKTPYFKENGKWLSKNWQEAIEITSKKLQYNIQQYGSEQLAGIISPSSTIEELYLFQKIIRGLGSNNVDHRIREQDFSDQDSQSLCPTSLISPHDLENSDRILIFATNVDVDQPLLTVRIRNAVKKGAKIYVINPIDYEFSFDVTEKIIVTHTQLPNVLGGVIKQGSPAKEFKDLLAKLKEHVKTSDIFEGLATGKKITIITGSHLYQHKDAATMRILILELQRQLSSDIMYLTQGSNSVGAWLAGCIPHREVAGKTVQSPGLTALDSFKENLQTYCLFGIEPEFDCLYPGSAMRALKEASLVIMFSPYVTNTMLEYADIILPISTFAETPGCYMNLFGTKQETNAAISPIHESRPGWKVLRALAAFLQISGIEYLTEKDVHRELQQILQQTEFNSIIEQEYGSLNVQDDTEQLSVLFDWPAHSVDHITRRSHALQEANEFSKPVAYINVEDAAKLSLVNGDRVHLHQEHHEVNISIEIDQKIPSKCIYVPLGITATSNLTQGKIEIKKC